jgi:hypothetical protein
VVGGQPGHQQREPRLREPAAGGRGEVLRPERARQPDHRHGSTFVDPASLPADTASAPLETSAPGNYYAHTANIG